MKRTFFLHLTIALALLSSCSKDKKADGYGNFEATEITVSAQANGKIESFPILEGDQLKKGEQVAQIDTVPLHLKKLALMASKASIAAKSGGVWAKVNVLKQQLKDAKTEQKRIQNMFSEKAATQQQVDKVNNAVGVLKKKMEEVKTKNAAILNQVKSIEAKIDLLNNQLSKSTLTNPINGTVLNKYAEIGELASFGRPMYKIANLKEMNLRVYVSEKQLPAIKIGQKVTVKIDSAEKMKDFKGVISWISAAAEFTPKIIQTKEARVNLVYAVKVRVKNDGSLKIGMPGEMWIKKEKKTN